MRLPQRQNAIRIISPEIRMKKMFPEGKIQVQAGEPPFFTKMVQADKITPNTTVGALWPWEKARLCVKRRRQGAYKVKINRTFLYFIAHKAQKGTNCVCLVVFFASYGRMFLQEILFLYRCTVTTPVRYAILISTMPGKRAVHMKEKRIFCPLNQRKDLAR